MRFIYADTGTNIHAEPFAYHGVYVTEENMDDNQVLPSSLALELSPFQQQFRSFLKAHAQAVRKNLSRIAFYNTNIITPDAISKVKERGNAMADDLITFIPYSRDQVVNGLGQSQSDAITEARFTYLPTTDVESHIRMLLSVVERMLGYTAQEVGAPASHEQSATEVSITSANSSVRLEYIGAGIDAGINAKKRAIVEAFAAYGSDEFFIEVSDLTKERREALKRLGFEVEDGTSENATSAGFWGSKQKLNLSVFISEREGVNRLSDSKVGVAMLQMMGVAMNNPLIIQRIGVDQLIVLLNYILRMMGLPEDFRLRPIGDGGLPPGAGPAVDPTEVKQAIEQSVASMAEQIVAKAVQLSGQQVAEQVVAPLQQRLEASDQALAQLAQADQQIGAALSQMQAQDQEVVAAIQDLRTAVQQLGVMNGEIVENQRGAAGVLAAAAGATVGSEQ
jgi:hypothetical protein